MSSSTTSDSSSVKTTTTNNSSSYIDSFLGLREQIMANASVLCPHIVATHTTNMPFQIIIIATDGSKRALLLYGDSLSLKIAARGPLADSDEAALQSLLLVTSEALGWYTETLLGELENAEEVAGGEIDFMMVEQGFHFAAEQRILGEI